MAAMPIGQKPRRKKRTAGEAEEKRQKATTTTGSCSRKNPIKQIWSTRWRIGRLETLRATWTLVLSEEPCGLV